MEHRLPIVARWSLYALGAVEGQRVRRPRDPVAAWLIRRHPALLPTFAAPSMLSMIRTRCGIVDRMIQDEAHRAQRLGRRLALVGVGGGLDARWYRLRPLLEESLSLQAEVEEEAVLSFKAEILADSSFADAWEPVERRPLPPEAWTVAVPGEDPLLVILEGVVGRLGLEGLRDLLRRLRADAPRARVVVDLPGVLQPSEGAPTAPAGPGRLRWSSPVGSGASALREREFQALGWRIDEEVWLASRPELRAPSGMSLCPGMEALRVLRLVPGPLGD